MENESADRMIGIMREIVKRYDAGDEDVIQTFELDYELTPPHGGWSYPLQARQSPGFRGEVRAKYFFRKEMD